MIAECLSVGTELLLGEIIDTNSAYLAQELARRGVDVYWSQRVGDNLLRLSQALEQALSRSELVLLTGGLGPTDDDLTREAIAAVLGETPQVDEGLEHSLRERFATFSQHMPARNLKQAWLIPSATALPNPLGTAPGWFIRTQVDGKTRWVVALPGPPRELRRMWMEEVMPRLELPGSSLFTRTFKTHGLGESGVAERLDKLTLEANPSVATYAKRDGVHVRVAAKAETKVQAEALAQPVLNRVQTLLQDVLWGMDDDELVTLIHERLQQRKQTLATVESLTGGMLGELLTSVASASTIYPGGVVAYTSQMKAAFGVPEELLEAHSSVSRETASAMAKAVRELFNADYGLATTGVAGPSPSEEKEIGEVYVAIFDGTNSHVKALKLPPLSREWIRERTSFSALAFLLKQLRS